MNHLNQESSYCRKRCREKEVADGKRHLSSSNQPVNSNQSTYQPLPGVAEPFPVNLEQTRGVGKFLPADQQHASCSHAQDRVVSNEWGCTTSPPPEGRIARVSGNPKSTHGHNGDSGRRYREASSDPYDSDCNSCASSTSSRSSFGRDNDTEEGDTNKSRSSSGNGERGKRYPRFTCAYASRFRKDLVPFIRCVHMPPSVHASTILTQPSHVSNEPLCIAAEQCGSGSVSKASTMGAKVHSSCTGVSSTFILYNAFVYRRTLGKGTYSKVVLVDRWGVGQSCTPTTGTQQLALKIFRNDDAYREACWDEVLILHSLCQPVLTCSPLRPAYVSASDVWGPRSESGNHYSNVGRFVAPLGYIPHPVHPAVVYPLMGPTLLEVLRNIKRASMDDFPSSTSLNGGSNQSDTCSYSHSDDLQLQRRVKTLWRRGIPIPILKVVLYQVLLFLRHAHERGVVHTDMKPENVVFECTETLPQSVPICRYVVPMAPSPSDAPPDPRQWQATHGTVSVDLPFLNSIRVIDMGSCEPVASFIDRSRIDGSTPVSYRPIQTSNYRSPEVLLDAGWSYSADMFSLGCMIPELLTGECLFMPRDTLEHLTLMHHMIGPFVGKESTPHPLMGAGSQRVIHHYFFDHSGKLKWPTTEAILLEHEELKRKCLKSCEPERSSERRRVSELCQRLVLTSEKDMKFVLEKATLKDLMWSEPQLLDLTQRMLCYNPVERITAAQALQHPFFHSV